MKKIIIALLAVVMVVCCFTLVACNNKAEDIINSYIFEQDGLLVDADFTLPLEIGGQKAKWESNSEFVTLVKRENDWLAKVSYPEQDYADVTITLTIGNASKDFKVTVKAIDEYSFMDSYVFLKDKATISADFDLDSTFKIGDKSCSISWSVKPEYELYLKISENGKKCIVYTQSEPTPVEITATFEYQGRTATKSYSMSVYQELSGLELVDYWYSNTGVSIEMSGYVVLIGTEYSSSYNNVTLYMVNDDYTAGYYLYRVKTTDEHGANLKPGAHITVTGTTNTNYQGLIETNAGGNLVVDLAWEIPYDESKAVKAIDEEVIGNLPATIYNESRLVSLTNWKVKEHGDQEKIKAGGNFTLMTITKGGVDVPIRMSKYLEGAYKADDATYSALLGLLNTYQVGSTINIKGIFTRYNDSWQIMPLSVNDVTAGGEADADDKKDYVGNKVADAIKAVEAKMKDQGLDKRITSDYTATLDTTVGDITVDYIINKSNSVSVKDGVFTVKPGNPEITTVQITYTLGDFSTVQFIHVESLIPSAASMLEDLEVVRNISEATDLPIAPEGATLVWEMKDELGNPVVSDTLKIENGQLIPTLKEKASTNIITATLTYKGVTRSRDFVIVVNAGKGAVAADTPYEEDKAYYLAINQLGRLETLYIINEMNGYFIASTNKYTEAPNIYVENVEGGFYLYFKSVDDNKNEVKTYISAKVNGTYNNILLVKESELKENEKPTVWSYDAEKGIILTTLVRDEKDFQVYIGTYGTYNTLSLSTLDKLSSGYPAFIANIAFVPLQNYDIKSEAENADVVLSKTSGINGEKFTFTIKVADGYEVASVKVGDKTIEAVDGVYTASVKGETIVKVTTRTAGSEDPNAPAHAGTEADPYTIADINKLIAAETEELSNIYVKGVVVSLGSWSDQHSNYNDGYLGDSVTDANKVYVYVLIGINKGTLEVGDEVVCTATLTYYSEKNLWQLKFAQVLTRTPADSGSQGGEVNPPVGDTSIDPAKPEAGNTYVIGFARDSKIYYVDGAMAAIYYFNTVESKDSAIKVYVESVDGGYNIYVSSDNGTTKKYINVTVNGTHVNSVYQDTAATVWTWDDTLKTLKTLVNSEDYVLGTAKSKTYTSVGPVKANADENYIVQFVLVEKAGGSEGGEVNPPAENTTVSFTMQSIATENSWENSKQYESFEKKGITFSATGTPVGNYGSNTGKYYESGSTWRIYQNENPSITISAPNGKKIVSIKITYASDNTGILTKGETQIASGEVVSVNAISVEFSVGNTGTATNGQVRITAIEVVLGAIDGTEIVVPVHTHTYGDLVPAKEPTCGVAGNVAYYECSDCHKFFDADKKEIESVEIEPTYSHVDTDEDGVCDECDYQFHALNGSFITISFGSKYLTSELYEYTSKNGSKKWEIVVSEDSTKAVVFMVKDNGDNTVSLIAFDFVTYDYSFLYCDGTNVNYVTVDELEEGDNNYKFTLETTDGGYFIKTNVVNFGKTQYLEVYGGYVTCYGMSTTDTAPFLFTIAEYDISGGDESEVPIWSNADGSIVLEFDGDQYSYYTEGSYEYGETVASGYIEVGDDGSYSFFYARGFTVSFVLSADEQTITLSDELLALTNVTLTAGAPSAGEEGGSTPVDPGEAATFTADQQGTYTAVVPIISDISIVINEAGVHFTHVSGSYDGDYVAVLADGVYTITLIEGDALTFSFVDGALSCAYSYYGSDFEFTATKA